MKNTRLNKFKFSIISSLVVIISIGIYLNMAVVFLEEGWPFESDENTVSLPNPQCSYNQGEVISCRPEAIYPGVANLTPAQYLYIQLNVEARRENGSFISPIARLLHPLKIEVILILILELYNNLNASDFSVETLPESISYQCNDICLNFLELAIGNIDEISEAISGKTIVIAKENLPPENLLFDYKLIISICNAPNICNKVDQTLYKKEDNGSLTLFRTENNQNGQHSVNIKITPHELEDTNDVYFTFKWEYVSAPPDLNDDGLADFNEDNHGLHVYRGMANTWPVDPEESVFSQGSALKNLYLTSRIGSSKQENQDRSQLYTLARNEEGNYSVVFKPINSGEGPPENNFMGCFQLNQDLGVLEFFSVTQLCDGHKSLGLGTDGVDEVYSLIASTSWINETPARLDFNDLSFTCKSFEVMEEGNKGCIPLVDISNMDLVFDEEINDVSINYLRCLYESCQIQYSFSSDCDNLTGGESYSDLILGVGLGYNEALEEWKSLGEEMNPGRCLLLKAVNTNGPDYINEVDDKLINPFRFYASDGGGENNLPECEEGPYFTHSPINEEDIRGIVPLGANNPPGHTFPTDHIYIYAPDSDPDTPGADVTNVYSPGNVTITSMSSYAHQVQGFTDYQMTLYACKEYSFKFGHIQTLSEKLQTALEAAMEDGGGTSFCNTYSTGGETYDSCKYNQLNIEVEAGEFLGTIAGNPTMYALDIWATDLSEASNTFASEYAYKSGELDYRVCPLDQFSETVKEMLESHLGSYDGSTPRIIEPLCGEFAQDIAGMAQGQWYRQGKENASHEDPHIALVHDNVDPTIGAFSIGTSIEAIGSTVYHFNPIFEGVFNRDFSEVSNDGNSYCYTVHPYFSDDPIPGSILIKMTTETTLLVEYREDFECDSADFYNIAEDEAFVFIR